MARVVGILNLHNDPSLGQLTQHQPVGSTSFLGRYSLMDFALSNFANSGINIIEIFNPYHMDSIRSHIRDGNVWLTNTKTGFIRLFVNEEKINYIYFNTDINNVLANIKTVNSIGGDYVIIANSHYLFSLDWNEVLEQFKEKDADIISLYKEVKEDVDDYISATEYKLHCGKITSSNIYNGGAEKANISLDTYVMKMSTFKELIALGHEKSQAASIKAIINIMIANKNHKILGYKFNGYVVPVLSFEQYIKQSFKLLEYKNRKELFLPDWPILTTTHNTPPALYHANANVTNSFVANGSIIKGKVTNSILSRDVIVEEGAEVENCILFTDTVIGNNVKVSHIVSNKKVKIINVPELKGKENKFVYIKREETV